MNLKSFVIDLANSYFQKGLGSKFFLGFTCGIPFLLRLAILDIWLKDCGLSNSAIGFFTIIQWPYILKFLWAPFIEKFDFPILSKILKGRKKGWAVASQLLLFVGILGMATSSPDSNLYRLLFFASIVAFADGCQDVSIYACQWDRIPARMYGPTAGVFVLGYRLGLFFSKSLTLYIAHFFNWNYAYGIMAFSVFLCTIFILRMPEPLTKIKENESLKDLDNFSINSIIKITLFECLLEPFQKFLKNQNWMKFISIIMLYRTGDILFQKMSKLFYIDLGFSILDIANVVQVFGSIATLLGSIIGGYFIKKIGLIKSMFCFAIIHGISCYLCYILLAVIENNLLMLYLSVFIEHGANGAIATAFVAFLYCISDKKYVATQYALLWAFYGISSMFFRSISGILADSLGWMYFFFIIPFTFIPSLLILYSLKKDKILDKLQCNT